MFANQGFFLILLGFICSFYGFVAAILAAFWRHRRLYFSSKLALTVTSLLVISASGIMIYSLFQRDYSLAYVMKNSSNDLPQLFTLTAFWSSLEGSHMLWLTLMTIVGTIAAWSHSKDNEHIMPYVLASIQAVICWMLYLAWTHSDPFLANLPAPPNGRGMNELLQNGYMAIHPPMLFTGYTCLVVPFAYSIAALCYGDITEGWLKTIRRWTLVSFIFLTAAITLGGRWAYVELGWGGYWAWDPVENSSFMPWLMATALLHSLLVQDKTGHLKRLSLVLAIAGFFMTFFGTFLTRSGVVSSVHSFAESPIGPNYLMYLAALMLISASIFAFRAPSILPSDTEKVWGVSRESALVVTQFLLISFAAIVLIGTLFPIVSEWLTKQRISVQAPYFNMFAPWVGLGIIFGVAVGNLLRYGSPAVPHGKRIVLSAIVFAIPLTVALVYFGDVMHTATTKNLIAQLVGLYLASWAIGCLIGDLYYRFADIRFKYVLFFKRNLGYFGGWVSHLGILIAIIGFLGNYRGMEHVQTVKAGDSWTYYGLRFEFQASGVESRQNQNATNFTAPVKVYRGTEFLYDMAPAQSLYPTKNQTFTEVAIEGDFWHDVYLVLADYDKTDGKRATFKLYINPTVRFVWSAIVIICIGGIIALFDRYRGNKSRDVVAGEWETSI
ncbi:MAG: heme lyase CcmF/NrfE family subunit [Chitinophagaceae bacterium]|nr:heme lyase CcmF/NrfE family subunit [Oligoflexus sp.]